MFRALVHVRGDEKACGWILEYQGEEIVSEIEDSQGRFLDDHNCPPAPRQGLLLFEGFIEVEALVEGESDAYWRGGWRDLTHWEMLRVREGLPPWEDDKG